jgi:rhodanese-related sulfurtransferase
MRWARLLYAGAGVGIGMIFHDAVADVLAIFEQMGRIGLMVLLVAIRAVSWRTNGGSASAFTASCAWPAFHPQELLQLTQGRIKPAVILDVRTELSACRAAASSRARCSGRTWTAPWASLDLPHDVAVVVYCACPNDASAALVARRLMAAGVSAMSRPLHGGIDAWQAAGLSLEYPAQPA